MSPSRPLRGVLGWLPAVLVVAASMTLAARVATPADPEAATRRLFPLDTGTTWVYAVTDHGQPSGTHTRQVVSRGQFFADGKLVTNVARVLDTYTDYPGVGPRRTTSYFHAEADQIVQYGVVAPSLAYLALDPPAKVYEVADVGTTFDYQGTYGSQDDFRFSTRISKQGPVTAAGRRYDGCTENVTTSPVEAADGSSSDETLTEWTCPDVGPVKTTDTYATGDVDMAETLVAFSGQSGSWGEAATASATASKAQPAAGLGLDEQRTNAVAGAVGGGLDWSLTRDSAIRVPPASSGSTMVTGDDAGWVSATDVRTGVPAWRVRLAPPILVAPVVAGDSVLVAGADRRLWALSLVDGSTRWVHDLDDVVTTAPSVAGSTAIVATDDGALTALDVQDGSELWSRTLGGRLTSAASVDDRHVYAADASGALNALDLTDGSTVWSRSVSEGTLTGPTVSDGLVMVQDDSGVAYAFHHDSGSLAWETRTRGLPTGDLAAGGDVLVVAMDYDELDAFDLDGGDRLWRREVPYTVVPPVLVGDDVVSVSRSGRVTVLSRDDGRGVRAFDLPTPMAGQRPYVTVPLALVDRDLVITSRGDVPMAGATVYGYPLDGRPGDGVLLDLRPRTVPAPPVEPMTALPDGGVLVPGYDHDLVRVDPDGRATTLVHDDQRLPSAGAPAGDLVVTHLDNRLAAVPDHGGAPVWETETGDTYLGSAPAVHGDTVYAGTDGRLDALGLADGKVRWTAPVHKGYLPGRPLVLSDGDAVYGVGLARYDAATGHAVWSHPDQVAVGAPVEATDPHGTGSSIVAAVDGADGTNGLGAWDAATGAQRWFAPGAPASYVGPAAGDGLVVWVDQVGTVRAIDVHTGRVVWSAPLGSAPGGVPAIQDGRVYVTVAGTADDFDQRDFDVLALDLATGRFLGSWEPPVQTNWIVPSVTPGLDSPLLVPTSSADYVVVEVAPHG